MKVKELIKQLSEFDENDEVRIEAASHDYWKRYLALEPRRVEEMLLEYTSYHDADEILDEEDYDREKFEQNKENKPKFAVVIRIRR